MLCAKLVQSSSEFQSSFQVKNYDTGEIGGPVGSRAGSEPTRFGMTFSVESKICGLCCSESRHVTEMESLCMCAGDWERNGRCSDF